MPPTFTVHRGEGTGAPSARHRPYVAGLTSMWHASVQRARLLTLAAEQRADPRTRARLMVLAAFDRAHASRLLARLAGLGRGPLTVPESPGTAPSLAELAASLRRSASVYERLAEECRTHADLSSVWVCELNRTECKNSARELDALAQKEKPA